MARLYKKLWSYLNRIALEDSLNQKTSPPAPLLGKERGVLS
ncbi:MULTISPECIES: hypothetical protein [Fischerella]|nr:MULTISPECIES: hypothetical protein [Fischerella]